MLKALLHSQEPGRICEIRNPGEEFEVHPAFSWVDVPDGTTTADQYNEDGTVTKNDMTARQDFIDNAYRVARGIGYGSIGDQLDMLYKEIQATGTISNTGPWATHINNVKQTIPKDDIDAVIAWNEAHLASLSANASPQ
jgi:hypothetical protein